MKEELRTAIAAAVQKKYDQDVAIQLSRPDLQFGDYATNVALLLAASVAMAPRTVAEALAPIVKELLPDRVESVSVAGPGFLNIRLTNDGLLQDLGSGITKRYADQVVVTEYSDPNPFKALHAGHLYTTVVGNAVSLLIEAAGGRVHRVNFGGDVGLHVGKAIWGIVHQASPDDLDEQAGYALVASWESLPLEGRARAMAACYAEGHIAYEEHAEAKAQIIAYNRRVYGLHESNDKSTAFAQIYWVCRDWSYDYFKTFYDSIGVQPFEKFYPESQTAPLGIATVEAQVDSGVYTQSEGAIVFNGEAHGLHTRVFINSHGLPTYEAKDVGLLMKKWDDYHFDRSIVITGNDIIEYMKVVLMSVRQFAPELADRSQHLTHGQVKMAGGVKMSSRKGNTLFADDVLSAAQQAATAVNKENTTETAYAAVKYAFLKQRIGGDIVYDPNESVSLEGNSGPYLQYAHARARSILARVPESERGGGLQALSEQAVDEGFERTLLRKLCEYVDAVDKAVEELMPHHVCTYLYELAQVFNRFYEQSRVIGDPRQAIRLALVMKYADTLQAGLRLLGMSAPLHM